MYGGQVVAQALRAAALTVDARHGPQSLHGYFVAAGDSTVPIEISVERLRDGTSFATRRVVTRQRNKTIFALQASFHVTEVGGGDYQRPMTPGLAGPEEDGPWTRPMGPTYFPELFETREFPPQGKDQAGVFGSQLELRCRRPDHGSERGGTARPAATQLSGDAPALVRRADAARWR
jgi:acyl-CoA thioesterase II